MKTTTALLTLILLGTLAGCGGEMDEGGLGSLQSAVAPPLTTIPGTSWPLCSATQTVECCGDGVWDGILWEGSPLLEQCDGKAGLSNTSCVKLGYSGGSVGCSSLCRYTTTGCYKCGDGVIATTKGEQCEGTTLGGKTCASLGYAGGTLSCSPSTCTYDTSKCYSVCGNGKKENGEQCDGTDFGAWTCASWGWSGGILSCSSSCTISQAQCNGVCGNGKKDAGEQCDGGDLGGKTCVALGFAGGQLSCSQCKLITSGCTRTSATAGSISGITSTQITAAGLSEWWYDQTYNALTCDDLGQPGGACYECGKYATACADRCFRAGYVTQEWWDYQFQLCLQDENCDPSLAPASRSTTSGLPATLPPDIEVVDYQRCLAERTFTECVMSKPYCKKCGECRGGCGFWQWLGCIVQGAGCAVTCVGGGLGCATCPFVTAYACAACF